MMSSYHDFHCATQIEVFKIVSTLTRYSFWSSIVFEWSDQHKLPSSLQVASHPYGPSTKWTITKTCNFSYFRSSIPHTNDEWIFRSLVRPYFS